MSDHLGLLIAFEGAGRSGKSTLIHLLKSRIEQTGRQTVLTEWNSYPNIQEFINHKKTYFTFHPLTYSLLHLSDFALRHEEVVKPSLEKDDVVIADRWVYTPLTRDVARGLSPEYVRQCYAFARKADIVFYVEVPVEVALARHRATKEYFGYNSGTDIWPDVPPEDAFCRYQKRLTELYAELDESQCFIKLDGLKAPEELLEEMWVHVRERLG